MPSLYTLPSKQIGKEEISKSLIYVYIFSCTASNKMNIRIIPQP